MRTGVNCSVTETVSLLLTGGAVLTMDPERRVYWPGAVAITGDQIRAVGPPLALEGRFSSAEHIDASGCVIMPGLINCHGHASMVLLRGIGEDMSLAEWLAQVAWPGMAQATHEDLYRGAYLACLEMLRAGITTTADMWPDVSAMARAVQNIGLRAVLAHNLRDDGDATRAPALLETAVRAWEEWDGQANRRIHVGLAPHSVYTTTEALLTGARDAAERKGLHLQVHLLETRQERDTCMARKGMSPAAYLDRLGLLGPHVLAAHGVWLSPADIELLTRRGVSVAHCPTSNLKLASGIAPVPELLAAGITVGLGTDSACSNNTLDLFREMKTAAMIQKTRAEDARVLSAEQVLAMVTCRAAQALGLAAEVGSLEPGKKADLVLINLARPHLTPLVPGNTAQLLAHLVYAAGPSDVDTVIIDGRVLVRGGRATSEDEDAIMARAQESACAMVARAGL